MDTKSKSIKYASMTKMIAAILTWLSFMGMFGSSFYLLYHQDNGRYNNYYETTNFQMNFTSLVHNVVEQNAILISEENILTSKYEEYVIQGDEYTSQDIHYIVQDKLYRYRSIQRNLDESKNFIYLAINTKTNEQVTNIESSDPLKTIKNSKSQVYLSEHKIQGPEYLIYYDNFYDMLSNSNLEIYAAVKDPLVPGDIFYEDFMTFTKIKEMTPYIKVIAIICVPLFLFLAIYLLYVAGRKEKNGLIYLNSIDRMYTDIHTFLVFIAAVLSLIIVGTVSTFSFLETLISISIFLTIDYWIGFSYVMSMTKQIKNKTLFKNTLLYVLFNAFKQFIRLCFSGKVFKASILLLILVYAAINSIIFGISISGDFIGFLLGMVFLLIFNTGILILVARSLISLSLIMENARSISEGNLDNALDSEKISSAFSGFAEDMKRIEAGLKKAVAEAVKGERMKADLITNVSHDLKTPLTSIVTYVDLLKKENLENEVAKGYVEILEEKSGRLKHLIEDLIEASKASSGNLTVHPEKIDLHELMQQACGEYDEALASSGLEVRIIVESQTYIKADGKYMWRIVENLMSNVIKYSLKNSRVYIDISRTSTDGILIIKNISAAPLAITPEQLTERFVRGDTSRTTEGSGLGLSIAQSLTTLQHGLFKIEIDGDLYKAIVSLPLWNDEIINTDKDISDLAKDTNETEAESDYNNESIKSTDSAPIPSE